MSLQHGEGRSCKPFLQNQNETKSKKKHTGNKPEFNEGLNFRLVGRLTLLLLYLVSFLAPGLSHSLLHSEAAPCRGPIQGQLSRPRHRVCPHHGRTAQDKVNLCLTKLWLGNGWHMDQHPAWCHGPAREPGRQRASQPCIRPRVSHQSSASFKSLLNFVCPCSAT